MHRLGPGLAADAAAAQGKTAEPSAMALGTVARSEFVSNKLAPKLAQQLKVSHSSGWSLKSACQQDCDSRWGDTSSCVADRHENCALSDMMSMSGGRADSFAVSHCLFSRAMTSRVHTQHTLTVS